MDDDIAVADGAIAAGLGGLRGERKSQQIPLG
jgi:hypothetical protein